MTLTLTVSDTWKIPEYKSAEDPNKLPFDVEIYINEKIDTVKKEKNKYHQMYNALMEQFKASIDSKSDSCRCVLGKKKQDKNDEETWYREFDAIEHGAIQNFIHVVRGHGYPCMYDFKCSGLLDSSDSDNDNCQTWKEINIKLK